MARTILGSLWEALVGAVFPPRCVACGELLYEDDRSLCAVCAIASEEATSPLCSRCGVVYPSREGVDHPCPLCERHPPPFVIARGAFVHGGSAKDALTRLKYGRRVELGRRLADLVATTPAVDDIRRAGPWDVTIPVPLHRTRLEARRFNQSAELAVHLAKRGVVPAVAIGVLTRPRPATPQVGLTGDERRRNVEGAFTLARPEAVRDRRVLLFDDVMTTGATAGECAKTLLDGGATAVGVLTFSRWAP